MPRGEKSHGLKRGAPSLSLGYLSSVRSTAKKHTAADAKNAPHCGMVRFKGEWVWCKHCAGSKSSKDSHSRLGDANEDYDNCSYYGSTTRLSKQKKLELNLNLRAATAAQSELVETVAPHVGHVARAAPGSCAVRTCAINSFLGRWL